MTVVDPADAVVILARRHGFSTGAVWVLVEALRAGRGRSAQWSHPELGGPGQWLAGGMLQIGDLFNDPLKARVATLLAELSAAP